MANFIFPVQCSSSGMFHLRRSSNHPVQPSGFDKAVCIKLPSWNSSSTTYDLSSLRELPNLFASQFLHLKMEIILLSLCTFKGIKLLKHKNTLVKYLEYSIAVWEFAIHMWMCEYNSRWVIPQILVAFSNQLRDRVYFLLIYDSASLFDLFNMSRCQSAMCIRYSFRRVWGLYTQIQSASRFLSSQRKSIPKDTSAWAPA